MHFDQIDWRNWDPREEATLLYVIRDRSILLIHKKRGIGAGKLNGPGGRIHGGESPQECAIRETHEELGVTAVGVRKCGEVLFQVLDGTSIRIHVFTASDCVGEPCETAEAIPVWAPLDAIPYERMWADDRYWIPVMLREEKFEVRTLFDDDTLLGHAIQIKARSFAW